MQCWYLVFGSRPYLGNAVEILDPLIACSWLVWDGSILFNHFSGEILPRYVAEIDPLSRINDTSSGLPQIWRMEGGINHFPSVRH
jgi:hypothetical protein